MQQLASRPHLLSPRERRTLAALARTIIPGSARVPPPGEETLDRLEAALCDMAPAVSSGAKALLWTLEMHTVPRYLRPFSALDPERQTKALLSLNEGSYPTSWLIRGLAMLLKFFHFHDAHLHREFGAELTLPVAATVEPQRWTDLVSDGKEMDEDDELECDVVVIGTGAGGAVIAKELAEAGLAVVMLEEGAYRTRREFDGDVYKAQKTLYRDIGGVVTMGNAPIVVPLGRAVGGTTTINSGTCLPPPDEVLSGWVWDLGLSDFRPEKFAPYVERVQEFLEVGPSEDRYLGDVAQVVARGCDALGFAHGPLPRNAPGCDGQGRCAFGCPTDAKRSTNVSYVPSALRANAFLFTRVRAEEILVEDGRAAGVRARAAGGGQLTVRASATVVACGALVTPDFLARQELCGTSGELGKNLSIHPAVGMMAELDHVTDTFKTVPQGYGVHEFWSQGLLFEGGSVPPDILAMTTTQIGPEFMEVADIMDRTVMFGFAVKDSSRGAVRRGVNGRPLVTYNINARDFGLIQRGIEIMAQIFFAGGAKRMHVPIRRFPVLEGVGDLERLARINLKPRDLDMTAYHPLGTARMGVDPARSVVGPDHQTHDVADLYIVDGAAVPSSLGVNPQITIMAMATRAADLLADRLN